MRLNFAVIAFIISSTLGTGIFILPRTLGVFGWWGIIVFIFICLLCMTLSWWMSIVNPFDFMEQQLPRPVVKIIHWSYWMISWISTACVVDEMMCYLIKIVPNINVLYTEVLICLFCIFINLFGRRISNIIEIIITCLKITILLVVPIFVLCLNPVTNHEMISVINPIGAVAPSIWCFVGVECGFINNQEKNISFSTVFGVFITALIYLLNIGAIFLMRGFNNSYTVYTDVMELVFPQYGNLIMSVLIFFICFGTLNSWILASANVACQNAEKGLFPSFFNIRNRFNTPYISMLLSTVFLFPIFAYYGVGGSIGMIINQTASIFLIFYGLFCLLYGIKYKSNLAIIMFIIFIYIVMQSSVLYITYIALSALPLLLI